MQKITIKDAQRKLEVFAQSLGLSVVSPLSKHGFFIDNNPLYGGCYLCYKEEEGKEKQPFGVNRVTPKELWHMLDFAMKMNEFLLTNQIIDFV